MKWLETAPWLALAVVALGGTTVAPGTAYAQQGEARPRYSLVVDGQEVATFSEATFNARANPPTVVLKGGRPIGQNLRVWHEAAHTIQQGRPAPQSRKSASIVMYNYDGQPVARYHIENAWPSKMEIGGLRADSNEGLLETVTLTAERIQRVAP